mgnify:CR=1 FL=1
MTQHSQRPADQLFTERTPRVVAASKLLRAAGRRKAGRFLAEGSNAVTSALAAGLVDGLFVTEEGAARYPELLTGDEAYVTERAMRGEIDFAESLGYEFDHVEGLHVHIPRGEARCEITSLDLEYGYDLAQRCSFLHSAGLSEARDMLVFRSDLSIFLSRIEAAKTRDELKGIMALAPENDDLRAEANKKWATLS